MMNFHKTKAWLSKREKILRRDRYLCQECKRYGKTTAANTVHHIYPIALRPGFKLLSINLISLCPKCHNEMHDRVTDALTAKGLQWVDRIKDSTPPGLE
jgi:5-methylcytosine-specific restriction endonuclease McrA